MVGYGQIASHMASTCNGMNTKQLIVLWYACLAVATALGIYAFEHDDEWLSPILAIIVLVAALLVYSFRQHPAANKRRVFQAVGYPILGIGLIGFAAMLLDRNLPDTYCPPATSQEEISIPVDKIEVFDYTLSVPFSEYSGLPLGFRAPRLIGRVRNKSENTLISLDLKITVYDAARPKKTVVDVATVKVVFEPLEGVPPGGVRSFEVEITELRPPEKWECRCQVINAQFL
ncbi:MAG: hypothetical protein Q8M92_08235 [Candidatus Subteraquimicrobiales bacterium]|nr:hypothetical protein [Candidatus Subteraquimicrobiales bacterium]